MWEDVHDAVDRGLIQDAIGEILNSISDRQRTVLIYRFWFGMTYKEIGDKQKVCAARISQIESKAIRVLRKPEYVEKFKKLGIDWIDKFEKKREKEKKDRHEFYEKLRQEQYKKNEERLTTQRIEGERLAKLRAEKAKAVWTETPSPETIVKPYVPKPPYFPPHFVKLQYNNKNEPFLEVHWRYGSINRERDPETYDRWVQYLINPKSNKVYN